MVLVRRSVAALLLSTACAFAQGYANLAVGPAGQNNTQASATQGCDTCKPVGTTIQNTPSVTVTNPGLAGWAGGPSGSYTLPTGGTFSSPALASGSASNGTYVTINGACRAQNTATISGHFFLLVSANQTLKPKGAWYIFSAAPNTGPGGNFNNNTAWNPNLSDAKTILLMVIPFDFATDTGVTVYNPGSGTAGTLVDILDRHIELPCTDATGRLFALEEITNNYVWTTGEVHMIGFPNSSIN